MKKIKISMKYLSKNILLTIILTVFLGITNNFAQSESSEISNLVEQKREFNKENKSSVVYKIQLYNGDEDESYTIERNFRSDFPEYKVKVVYDDPEFKTQVGDFKTRLEADRILMIIKEKFGGAIVLEDKI